MSITLRSTKGSPLTHTELDNNFREFYYSSSIEGSAVIFHRFTAISSSVSFPVNPPNGKDQYIQIKLGDAVSGSQAIFTGSADFRFDYQNSHLKVTGSHTHVGTSIISGSQTITGSQAVGGNLVVGGTVTAEEFISQKVATTYLYKSGSTKFGDTPDDIHSFTGSVRLEGSLTGSDVSIDVWGSVSGSLASNLTYSENTSASLAAAIASVTPDWDVIANKPQDIPSSSAQVVSLLNGEDVTLGTINAVEISTIFISSSVIYSSGSNIFGNELSDKHEFTGSVNIDGVLSIPGFNNVSSSLAAFETADLPAIVVNLGLPVLASGITDVEVRTLLDVDQAGTDNSTDVTLNTSSYDYLSITGQQITLGVITNADLQNSTISGVTLGSNLQNLTVGTGINFDSGSEYNGGTVRQISIGQSVATDADVTFNKVTVAAGSGSGLTFPTNPGGGSSDEAKIVYYASTGENTVLELSVTNDADDNIYLNASGGTDVANDLRVTGNVTAFYSSDERQKDNIKNISQPIQKIKQIGGYEFDWNENSNLKGHDVGVIAQEIEKVLPEVVTTRDNGYKAVRYEKIVALLIEAVKEQQSQIEELKARL